MKRVVSLTCGFKITIWIESVWGYSKVRSRGFFNRFLLMRYAQLENGGRGSEHVNGCILHIVKRPH